MKSLSAARSVDPTRICELSAACPGNQIVTDFGLSAAVWSRDLVKARRVAGEIESGTVFIIDFTRTDPRAPFGGFKASGYGRELGAPGALELTNPKLIWQGA